MTKERQMQAAQEFMRQKLQAAGCEVSVIKELPERYVFKIYLPLSGDYQPLWLEWDSERREPRFYYQRQYEALS